MPLSMVMKDGNLIVLSREIHSCILIELAARGSRSDILTEIMHLYSTGGLTCYLRIRVDKSLTVDSNSLERIHI